MNRVRLSIAAWALAVVCVPAALAQPLPLSPDAKADDKATAAAAAHRKAGHEQIRRDRAALATERHQQDADCYQRFAVEDCLRAVRAKSRAVESRLRAQEVELNDAERRQKAADRLRSIEERKQSVPDMPRPAKGSGGAVREAPSGGARKVPADPRSVKMQRDQEAAQRAQQQRQRTQTQSSQQASRAAANADQAAKARERHVETLKAADARRMRVEKAKTDAAAQGRKPAAPLPLPLPLPSPAPAASASLP